MASKDREEGAGTGTTKMSDAVEVADSKVKNDRKGPRSGRIRTGLLLVGSALLGGIAVALWNRRSLTDIQNQAQEKGTKPKAIEDDAIY